MNSKKTALLFIALLMIMVMGGTALAAVSPPVLPDAFWGTITSLDGSAVNGGIIEGYIDNKLVSEPLSFSGNIYGGAGGYEDKLIVQAPSSEINKVVTFYVNGIAASPTDKYISAQIKNINLKIPYTLQGITVTTNRTEVSVGNEITYSVKAKYSNNIEQDVTLKPQTNVEIANPDIFVWENNALKAKAVGTTNVTISFYNQSKQITLTVSASSSGPGNGGSTSGSSGTTPKLPELTDVEGHWAKDYIIKLQGKGIIDGYTDGTFKPNNYVTRGEFAKILVLSAGLPVLEDSSLLKVFNDYNNFLPWVKPYGAAAIKAKIMRGYLDNTLKLDNKITRAEVAVMVASAISGDVKAALNFKDSPKIPNWARDAVAKVLAAGLINGYPDGTYKPDNFVTRAEIAKIMAIFTERK